MPPVNSAAARRQDVQAALKSFANTSLAKASVNLLNSLGYTSDKTVDLGAKPAEFVANLKQLSKIPAAFDEKKAQVAQWRSAHFVFQLTNDEIPSLMLGQRSFSTGAEVLGQQIESFVFLAIDLAGDDWSRTALATIARELNRQFPMPAILVFRHGARLSVAVIDRRTHKRDATRDVLTDRISIIKDIRLDKPHAAHQRILAALATDALGEGARRPGNFRELYDAWLNALSVQELNKKFYTELSHWYFWARTQVKFPPGAPLDEEGYPSIAVIRLLTRLIFVWFIKEKGLVPDNLFDADALSPYLKEPPHKAPDGIGYYQAILQNLFFATLNVELGDDEKGRPRRRWTDNSATNQHYLVPNIYRFAERFNDPAKALDELFGQVPYLNGGLFECLDRELTDKDFKRDPSLRRLATEEKTSKKTFLVLRSDGFSRRPESQAKVPNRIFFGTTHADLADALGDSKRARDVEVKGLLDIFANYKFTVDENTPVEEEVALDPELLGKVFENLLASFNKDTKLSARKQSGSFYTPREVVDYMVDEALVATFATALGSGAAGKDNDRRLRHLLGYRDEAHGFSPKEVDALITAIEQLKILDPACGSGAYPMGVLAKLVHVLRKLDPDNRRWRKQNRTPLELQLAVAKTTPDPSARAQGVDDCEAALRKFDATFNANHADYTRKLFLIEKCIHGVDIQPIAVQIAKLRFFIALIVEQQRQEGKENYGLTTLPNLETKIVAADTLLPIPRHSVQGSLLDDPRIAEVEEALRDASAAYFSARTRRTKVIKRERIQELHDELCRLLEANSLVTREDARRMASYDPFDQNAHAGFFDVEWMFGMHRNATHGEGVFDVLIGNPPYVRHEELADYKPHFKKLYECASGTADLYVYFYERAMQLLKPHGVLSFITSNKWYRAAYGKALRGYLRSHSKLLSIIDFGDEAVFTALAYPTIVVAQKRETPLNPPPDADEVLALNWSKEQPVDQFPQIFAQEAFAVPQGELKMEGWQLEPPVKRRLLQRLRMAGRALSEYCNDGLHYGIKTGFNEAFVIDGTRRAQLIAEDPRSAEVIKPYLRGRDVKRWAVIPQDLWLIFIPWHFPLHEEASVSTASPKAEKAFRSQYPAIYEHLLPYKPQLEARDKSETGIKYEWYALQRYREYWKKFEAPKIIFPAIEKQVNYAIDLCGHFGNDKTNIIVSEQWQYLLAVLNSSVSWWIVQQVFSEKAGGFFEFKPMYVNTMPIPEATSAQRGVFCGVVFAVLNASTSVPRFEQLVNGLVYELFFPDELHAAGIRLFAACEQENIAHISALQGAALATETEELAERIFSNSHPIYAMLFDLQALDVVRIIEGRE
ncbi:MAG: Eco57I restriction-modification methylase domain-containing protein [Sterolibacterium sp.]